MSEHVKELKATDFEEVVLKSSVPVVVDFWAPWCGPCIMLAPVLDDIAKAAEEDGVSVKFVKLNTDLYQELAQRYNIKGIPTFVVFENGGETDRGAGVDEAINVVDRLLERLHDTIQPS